MKTNQVSYIVDGGLLSNFPVWLFDSEGTIPEWPTFGFKLVEPGEGTPQKVRGPISLLIALFSTMSQAHDARYITDTDFVRTIPIPTLDVKTTDFDLTREKSEALYQSGRQAAELEKLLGLVPESTGEGSKDVAHQSLSELRQGVAHSWQMTHGTEIVLGKFPTDSLEAGASEIATVNVAIPPSVNANEYYVTFVVRLKSFEKWL